MIAPKIINTCICNLCYYYTQRLGYLHACATRLEDTCQSCEGEEGDEDRLVRLISGQVHAPHLVLSGLYDDPLPSDESESPRPRHRPLGCRGFRVCW